MDDQPAGLLPPAPTLRDGTDLLLRRHRSDDLECVYEQNQDPEMQRWTSTTAPYTRRDAQWFLGQVAEGWRTGSAASFAVELEGRFAGTVDLRLTPVSWADVGFSLSPHARGRGVMTRAVRLLLGWGFSELSLAGVHWRAHVGNTASRRVAQACGFRVEGEVRGLLVEGGRRIDGWVGSVLAGEPLAPAPTPTTA